MNKQKEGIEAYFHVNPTSEACLKHAEEIMINPVFKVDILKVFQNNKKIKI